MLKIFALTIICVHLFGMPAASSALAGGLILNEANCVGPRKWLANADSVACECTTGSACSTEEDVHFGRRVGNGGDWIELVVTTDHLDARGWKLRWAETDNSPGNADQANGTSIWTSGNIEQGEIVFTSHSLWADLRAGTIITISELPSSEGGVDTDIRFDPCQGDWWINIRAGDTQFFTTQINIAANSDGCSGPATVLPGPFNVGNDSWEITILNAQNQVQLGPIGESYAGGPGWQGSGINSREMVRLSENPSPSIGNNSFYEDCDQSSFGHPNRWSQTVGVGQTCPRFQDYRTLRSWLDCGCARVVLNEYNAVGEKGFLNGGTQDTDQTGGQAADSFFGRVQGNGDDWFELIATDDHVDMRNWKLFWEEVADNQAGTITLSNHPLWSNIRVGTVITFIRRDTAAGGLNTDVSYNSASGDRWINIYTSDATYIASTVSTVPSHGFGDFHTSNDNWRLTILNHNRVVVAMPSGEGAAGYSGRGVGADEVCALEQNITKAAKAWDNYNESIRSTFGALNKWRPCPGTTVLTQDLAPLLAAVCARAADTDGSGVINVNDLLNVINSWGACPGLPCLGDVDNNGLVNVNDLLAVINGWG